jgi:CubicO group peptidase (beta-lactamase class C family)
MNNPTRRDILAALGAVSVSPSMHPVANAAVSGVPGNPMRDNRYSAADMRKFHAGPMGSIYEVPSDRMRYIYRNMGQFLPQGEVSRGNMATRQLLPAPSREVADTKLSTQLGSLSLANFVAHPQSHIDALIVLRDNRILFESYPRMEQDDRHLLWSVTKTFVGHAVALLVDVGKIDPARAIDTYIPQMANSGWAGVPVRDILDMASGIDAEEGHPDAFKDPQHPYYQFEASIGYLPKRINNLSTYEVVGGYKKKDPPGTIYEYTSVNSFALAWLVEEVSGQPMARFVADHIWSKMGAERDAIWTISPEGATGADGGFSCTLRDLARYGLQHLTSEVSKVGNTISPAHFRRLTTTGRSELFRAERGFNPRDPDLPLFNCWHWDRIWSDSSMHKGGWGGQGLLVSPRSSVVVAWFGTPLNEETGNEVEQHARAIAAAGARVS